MLAPDRDRRADGVDVDDIAALTRRDAETAPLPDRECRDAVVTTHRSARRVDDAPRRHLRARGQELDPRALRHEADVHALRLRRGAEPEAVRVRAHLGLGELPYREHRAGELALREHVEDVRLVLGPVGAALEHVTPAARDDARVMPGGDE